MHLCLFLLHPRLLQAPPISGVQTEARPQGRPEGGHFAGPSRAPCGHVTAVPSLKTSGTGPG